MTKVVIPFVQINAHNPNLPKSVGPSTMDVYFKCITVAFASLRRWNPELVLQLTTNQNLPKKYQDLLAKFGVSTVLRDYHYSPPSTFSRTFAGCFYLFDAIAIEDEDVLFLDPDVLCVGELKFDAFEEWQILALPLDFPESQFVNGMTPMEARILFEKFTSVKVDHNQIHYGGEAIFISKKVIKQISKEIGEIWQFNLTAKSSMSSYFTTEEHIISCILRNYKVGSLSQHILRIWTTRSVRGVQGGVFNQKELPLWHLPAEKGDGFLKIWNDIDKSSWFYSKNNEEFRVESARIMNVSLNTIGWVIFKVTALVVTLRKSLLRLMR